MVGAFIGLLIIATGPEPQHDETLPVAKTALHHRAGLKRTVRDTQGHRLEVTSITVSSDTTQEAEYDEDDSQNALPASQGYVNLTQQSIVSAHTCLSM